MSRRFRSEHVHRVDDHRPAFPTWSTRVVDKPPVDGRGSGPGYAQKGIVVTHLFV